MENFGKKTKAVIIGHAVGDALGVPVEFKPREYLDANPVTDMIGYGSFPVPKGTWSDDTSMSLCALESLSKGKLDYDDIMNNFCKWSYSGEFTPAGRAFDIGRTCGDAIYRYFRLQLPYYVCGLDDEKSNGNGSLMRIHPVALYLAGKELSDEQKIEIIHIVSGLTHAHPRAKIACGIYSFVLWELLKNPCKSSIKTGMDKAWNFYDKYKDMHTEFAEELRLGKFDNLYGRILNDYDKRWSDLCENRDLIQSHGYVINTIESSIWCLLTTDSYKECVLKAVNLGFDADTTAAVAGGLAGALYGYDAIPESWRNTLLRREYIEDLCDKTYGG